MTQNTLSPWGARRLAQGLLAAGAVVALMVGCGGGVGTGGTGTYSYGPITGFGSIIVGGIRFDDSLARVEDEDGSGSTRDRLRLGMTVSIESDKPANAVSGSSATATVVRFGSVLEAPVSSVSATGLTALGQTVAIRGTTVIDDSLGAIAALPAGRVIEVHGFVDAASQTLVATRIEAASSSTSLYKVRGVVSNLDTTARTLRMGDATFDFGAAAGVPSGLANGQIHTLRVQTAQGSNGRWVVARFGSGVPPERPDGDRDNADIRGIITSLSSTTRFAVNGTPVDASAAVFEDGMAGVVLGARVEVEGRFTNGTLVATKVELESDDSVPSEGIDLRGEIESVNPTNLTFRLRGNTVYYGAPGVRFEDGNASNLTVGRLVRVRGVLSSDRTRVEAQRIEF